MNNDISLLVGILPRLVGPFTIAPSGLAGDVSCDSLELISNGRIIDVLFILSGTRQFAIAIYLQSIH